MAGGPDGPAYWFLTPAGREVVARGDVEELQKGCPE